MRTPPDQKPTVVPKKYHASAPTESWWAKPELQADREAFDARAAIEFVRMTGSPQWPLLQELE